MRLFCKRMAEKVLNKRLLNDRWFSIRILCHISFDILLVQLNSEGRHIIINMPVYWVLFCISPHLKFLFLGKKSEEFRQQIVHLRVSLYAQNMLTILGAFHYPVAFGRPGIDGD